MTTPLDFIDYIGGLAQPFNFEPGAAVMYSSTGFVVAGLILTAHGGYADWAQMRTSDFYPPARCPSVSEQGHLPSWGGVPKDAPQ